MWKTYKGPSSNTKLVVLSGSPYSVTQPDHPTVPLKDWNVPVFGICYGAQLIAKEFNCEIVSETSEFGNTELDDGSIVWMSHNDTIIPSDEIDVISTTKNGAVAFFNANNYYGAQFHPEVTHTEHGEDILCSFINLYDIKNQWTTNNVLNSIFVDLEKQVKDKHVIMALSGGVDSYVAYHLIKCAGGLVKPVLVDTGLLRKNEVTDIKSLVPELEIINIEEDVLHYLKQTKDPEHKRKILGTLFIDTFRSYSRRVYNSTNERPLLGQGTIYPDVIESLGGIKSHHNVGGLPKDMDMELVEPLRYLYKEEVRDIGNKMELSKTVINRYPFPGPGLAIRIIGEVTARRVYTLREADHIYMSMLKEFDIESIWQAGTILIPDISVGVTGDERSEGSAIVLRAVDSVDGMTAIASNIDIKILKKIGTEICNKVRGVNRVLYDLTDKPPATIEWQ